MTTPEKQVSHLERATRDAVEKGGYQGFEWHDYFTTSSDQSHIWGHDEKTGEGHGRPISDILLDPAFWQALGKARGWGSFYDDEGMPRVYSTQGWYPITKTGSGHDEQMWEAHWHRFIDHLASGGTVEDFFKNLDT